MRALAVVIPVLLWLLGAAFAAQASGSDQPVRRALLVGIDQYADPRLPLLQGAEKDVATMTELLQDSFHFVVHSLTGERATLAGFRTALADLASSAQPGDVVLVYFAGLGSWVPDRDGDETDRKDETLVFYDSRTGQVTDLSDDLLLQLLAPIYRKTPNLILILDTNGSPTRSAADYRVRMAMPDPSRQRSLRGGVVDGDWLPPDLPQMVVISAAGDGGQAYESQAGGLLTLTLAKVLAESKSLTYAVAMQRIRLQMGIAALQMPFFQGPAEALVFGDSTRRQPATWRITQVDGGIVLSGRPMAGMGPDAVLRVYRHDASGETLLNPSQAHGRLQVLRESGFQAVVKLIAGPPGDLQIGDRAVLARASKRAAQIPFRILPPGNLEGVSKPRAQKILEALARHAEAKLLVVHQEQQPGFTVAKEPSGHLIIRGPEGQIRNRISAPPQQEPETVVAHLYQQAQILSLLQLEGEGGAFFQDQHSLKIRILPRHGTAQSTPKPQKNTPSATQKIPYGQQWHVAVALAEDCVEPLMVSGLILSSDGTIIRFPSNGSWIKLHPGAREYTFKNEIFTAGAPLHSTDYIIVVGTPEGSPLELTSLLPGTRGEKPALSAWTKTILPVTVVPQ